MNKHIRKALAVLAAFILTATSLTMDVTRRPAITAEAKTLKEIELEKKEKQAQIDEKKAELAKLENDISKKTKYEQTLKEEIELINGKMLLIDTQMTNLIGDISDKEAEISELQTQIEEETIAVEEGMILFKKRIRTLYIHGNDSLLSALVGASNFYDVLAKIDIIKRVSQHDDDMIDQLEADIRSLTAHQQDLTASVQALNLKQTEIGHLQDEFHSSWDDLQKALAGNATELETITAQHKYTYIQLENDQKQLEAYDAEAEQIIQESLRKAMEEERKQKEAEEKKKAAEAAKRTTTTTTTTTTKATTTTTTTAKPIVTTAAPVITQAPVVTQAPAPAATGAPVQQTEAPQQYVAPQTTAAPVVQTAAPTTVTTTVTTAAPVITTTTTTPAPAPTGSMFAWPVPGHYGISSPFGYRLDPFGSGTYKGHSGIDIIGNVTAINGASACAAANGTVSEVITGWGGGYGNHVLIYHSNGYATLYAHLQSVSVSPGQQVTVGQEIGRVGSTGASTGPHLHFEVRLNGTPVDPMNYLPK